MRFLGDMGIGLDVIKALREAGHACTHLVEEGLERLSDAAIMEKAAVEERIILTHDLDFGRLLVLSGEDKPSVITFRLSDMRPREVISRLMPLIGDFQDNLTNGAAFVITDKGIRHRPLPIE